MINMIYIIMIYFYKFNYKLIYLYPFHTRPHRGREREGLGSGGDEGTQIRISAHRLPTNLISDYILER